MNLLLLSVRPTRPWPRWTSSGRLASARRFVRLFVAPASLLAFFFTANTEPRAQIGRPVINCRLPREKRPLALSLPNRSCYAEARGLPRRKIRRLEAAFARCWHRLALHLRAVSSLRLP